MGKDKDSEPLATVLGGERAWPLWFLLVAAVIAVAIVRIVLGRGVLFENLILLGSGLFLCFLLLLIARDVRARQAKWDERLRATRRSRRAAEADPDTAPSRYGYGVAEREPWVQVLVNRYRDPPRPVTTRTIVTDYLQREPYRRGAGTVFGVFYFVVVAVMVWVGWEFVAGDGENRVFLAVGLVVFAAGVVSIPYFMIVGVTRRRRWVRWGVLGTAIVDDVEVPARGHPAGPTVIERRAMVRTEDGRSFDPGLDLTGTWLERLRPGSRVVVLVDPRRDRVRWWIATETAFERTSA